MNAVRPSMGVSRVLRDALEYLPSTILPTVFAMTVVYVYTRQFSAVQYGMYNFAVSIVTPSILLITEWAGQPIGRYYADYEQRDKLGLFRLGVVSIILIIVGFALIVAATLTYVVIAKFSVDALTYTGIVAYVLSQCMFVLSARILPSSLRPHLYRRIMVWVAGLSNGISLLMMYLLGHNIAWLFWGQAVANTLLLPWLIKWNRLIVPWHELGKWTPELSDLFRQFWRYGAPMVIWFMSNHLLDDEDRWVLQWFHGSAQVGIYSVNYNLISAVGNFLNVPVLTAVGPILYYQWSMNRHAEARKTIAGMTELYFVVAAMVLGGTVAVGIPVVHVFLGASFWAGAQVLVPVLVGRIFWGAASIGHRTLELSERTITMGISGIIAAIINLLLNLLLVPKYGYPAAAMVTALSYGVYALTIRIQSLRYVPWDIHGRRIMLYVVIGLVIGLLVRHFINELPMWPPVTLVIVGLMVYIGLYVVVLCLLTKKHIKALLTLQS